MKTFFDHFFIRAVIDVVLAIFTMMFWKKLAKCVLYNVK
jgi:hypothetical protein